MDAILRPLELITPLYQQAGYPVQGHGDWGVAESFRSLLSDPSVLAQVPYVTEANVDRLPHNSLVRFRGMVQDMPNPEFYMGALQQAGGAWVTSKFQDLVGHAVENCLDSRIWERRPLYCVPLPGESAWAEAARRQQATDKAEGSNARGAAKRGRDLDDDSDAMAVDAEAASASALDGHLDLVVEQHHDSKASRAGAEASPAAATAGASTTAQQAGGCVVFLYDNAGEGCVLHDEVDVVAVLSKCPQLATLRMGAGEDEEEWSAMEGQEDSAAGGASLFAGELPPPTSQVLRLHAVLAVRCNTAGAAPLPAPASTAASAAAPAPVSQAPASIRVGELRSSAVGVLAGALAGDRLAAEYLLLQLLSRVVARVEAASGGGGGGIQQPIGMVPLNLTACPVVPSAAPTAPTAEAVGAVNAGAPAPAVRDSACSRAVVAAAAALIPAVQCVPTGVAALNAGPLAPHRDYNGGGRISASPLQLAQGTLLVLDETAMAVGKLEAQGVANLQDLQSVVQDQVLQYDFGFYKQPVPVNLPVLVLSGPRSVLKDALPVELPVCPVKAWASAEDVVAAIAEGEAAAGAAAAGGGSCPPPLAEVRAYLAAAAALPYSLDNSMSDTLQAHFVAKRKSDPQYGPEQFSVALTLARLAALSYGESHLSERTWSHVQGMEAKREARLRVVSM